MKKLILVLAIAATGASAMSANGNIAATAGLYGALRTTGTLVLTDEVLFGTDAPDGSAWKAELARSSVALGATCGAAYLWEVSQNEWQADDGDDVKLRFEVAGTCFLTDLLLTQVVIPALSE